MQPTLTELAQEIKNLKTLLSKHNEPINNWMNINEAAAYTTLSVSKIRKLIASNSIPFQKLPGEKGKIVFARKRLDLWLMTNRTSFTKRDRDNLINYV